MEDRPMNVLDGDLQVCNLDPKTGFFRDGYCQCDSIDPGQHTVCARMTAEFLAFSKERGNDLMTPRPEMNFPGLKPGDQWCLCVLRWKEALEAGVAPLVILAATHRGALDYVELEDLGAHALDVQ